MDKKSLLITVLAYVIWGFLPLYWAQMNNFDAVFILANRIIWCCLLTVLLLAFKKQWPAYVALFKNKKTLLQLVLTSLLITANWGVFIWGVVAGKVLDVAIGYYLTPLLLCFGGILFYRERGSRTDYIALAIAALGFLVSLLLYGSFPIFALILAVSFTAYSLVKKKINLDGLLSVSVESTIMLLPAILYCLLAPAQLAMVQETPALLWLLVGAGAVTALPMVLFSTGVTGLPMLVVGFIEYIAPCINLFVGAVLLHEALTAEKLLNFCFVWVALLVFSWGTLRKEKRAKALAQATAASAQKIS